MARPGFWPKQAHDTPGMHDVMNPLQSPNSRMIPRVSGCFDPPSTPSGCLVVLQRPTGVYCGSCWAGREAERPTPRTTRRLTTPQGRTKPHGHQARCLLCARGATRHRPLGHGHSPTGYSPRHSAPPRLRRLRRQVHARCTPPPPPVRATDETAEPGSAEPQ